MSDSNKVLKLILNKGKTMNVLTNLLSTKYCLLANAAPANFEKKLKSLARNNRQITSALKSRLIFVRVEELIYGKAANCARAKRTKILVKRPSCGRIIDCTSQIYVTRSYLHGKQSFLFPNWPISRFCS